MFEIIAKPSEIGGYNREPEISELNNIIAKPSEIGGYNVYVGYD